MRATVGAATARLRGTIGRSAPWLLGITAAAWAALLGLALAAVPMLIVWMASPESGLTWLESLRVAGLIWLVAGGGAISIAGVTYTLLPWGLTLIPLLLLGYGGGWAARRSGAAGSRPMAALVVSGALTYAVLTGVVATVTSGPVAAVGLVRAVGVGFLLALVALAWGTLRAAGYRLEDLVPVPGVPLALRSGVLAACVIVGLGAVAVTASLLLHVDDAITMTQSLRPGAWGGLGLAVLGLAYAPVAAVWGAAYTIGAGVVIGPAVTVSPFIAATPPTLLPPFPLLAALPATASPLAWALPLSGVLAGVLAGVVIGRTARDQPRLVRLALAVGAAVVAGCVLAGLAFLASGSLGDLRLEHLGPSALTVGVLGAVLVVLGAAPGSVVPGSTRRPSLAVATVTPDDDAGDSLVDDAP